MEDQAARARTASAMFEEWAAGYDTTIKVEFEKNSGASYEQYMGELLTVLEVPPGGEVLDVATGTGIVAIAIARELAGECRVVGIDASEAMLAQAEGNLERAGVGGAVALQVAAGEDLPFPDGSFDVVNCSLAVHHMDVPAALAEMCRVLKPSGRLVVTDFVAPPTWRTPWGRIGVPLFRFAMRFSSDKKIRAEIGHAAIHPRKTWTRLLGAQGLEILEFRTYPKPDVRQWEPIPFLLVAGGSAR